MSSATDSLSVGNTFSENRTSLLRSIFLVSRLNSLYPLLSLGYPMKMHTTDCLSSFPFRLFDGTRAKALQTNTRRTVDRWFFVVPELEWCLSLSFLAWLRFWIYTAVATASTQNFKPSLDWWFCHVENRSVYSFRNAVLLWSIRDCKIMLNSLSFTILFKCFWSIFNNVVRSDPLNCLESYSLWRSSP